MPDLGRLVSGRPGARIVPIPNRKGKLMTKYRENMTLEEIAQFKAELESLDNAYASAAKHDAQVQALNPIPDQWEDPNDYIGMGWIDSRGRP